MTSEDIKYQLIIIRSSSVVQRKGRLRMRRECYCRFGFKPFEEWVHFRKVRDYHRTLHMCGFKIFRRSSNVLKFLVRLFLCLSSSLECSSPHTVTEFQSNSPCGRPGRPSAVIDSCRLSVSVCVCVCQCVCVCVCVVVVVVVAAAAAAAAQCRLHTDSTQSPKWGTDRL